MCSACYQRLYFSRQEPKQCANCKQIKKIVCRNMCSACYQHWYQNQKSPKDYHVERA
jgi:hypothetical protein